MMEEAAKVIEVRAGRALVQTERSGACSHCVAKASCAPLGGGGQARVWAEDCVGVERGEAVVVEVPEKPFLGGAVLHWLVPVAASGAGVLSGTRFAAPRWGISKAAAGAALGTAAFVLAFAAVRIWERRRPKGPRIVRRVDDG